jgi:hypothetical protein
MDWIRVSHDRIQGTKSCEQDNEYSSSANDEEFLDQLRNCQLLNDYSTLLSSRQGPLQTNINVICSSSLQGQECI